MPNLPHGDRIRELERLTTKLETYQETATKALDDLGKEHGETVHKLDLMRQEMAVLKEKVTRLEAATNPVIGSGLSFPRYLPCSLLFFWAGSQAGTPRNRLRRNLNRSRERVVRSTAT